MKNTKYIILGLLLIAALALGITSCASTERGDGKIASPHSPNWLFRNCNTCHAGVIIDEDLSTDHSAFTNDDCMKCHGEGGVDHSTYKASDCASCHSADMPADHANFKEADCELCHSIGKAEVTTIELKEGLDHSAYKVENCATCHNGTSAHAYPADHASYTNADCAKCHPIGSASPAATAVDHSAYTFEDCANAGCHEVLPESHYYRQPASCGNCHTEGAEDPSAPDVTPAMHEAYEGAECYECHDNAMPDNASHTPAMVGMCTMCHGAGYWD